jgi:hypothetical protein
VKSRHPKSGEVMISGAMGAANAAMEFSGTMRGTRTGAHGCERPPRIDKLGVTGSSPVPPMKQPCKMG